MGKKTGISWTDHTFNPWWGCVEVSPACDNCYARVFANRMSPGLWGKDAPRRFFDDRHWQEPVHWNRQAEKSGVRRKVFCASMADVFEDRRDLDAPRFRLFNLIEQTPWLDWLLLTKRTDRIAELVSVEWLDIGPPSNAWFGTTVENQRMAEIRLPALRALPFVNPMPWVSYEPALGAVNWQPWLDFVRWIIFGGESGSDRKSEARWALDTLQQCRSRGVLPDGRLAVAYFNKQLGEHLARELGCESKAGKVPAEWPAVYQVQQFPDRLAA